MVDIGQRLLDFTLRRAEQEAQRQINRGFEEVFGRGSSRTVDSPGEQQLLSDANLFARNGTGALAAIANRELQALGIPGSQRTQILAAVAQDQSIRQQAQNLQYRDADTNAARNLIHEIQNKVASLYGTLASSPNSNPGNPNSRITPPTAPGVFDRVQPTTVPPITPSSPANLPASQQPVITSQQPATNTISTISRPDLFRLFSRLHTYSGRGGGAGRTDDLKSAVTTAWNQVRGGSREIPLQDLNSIVPDALVNQARDSLSFRITNTLRAPGLSAIPGTVLTAGNETQPPGSSVAPDAILQQIDRGVQAIAREAEGSGGSPAGQTINVLSVMYGTAALRLVASHGSNQGTQARIDRMLQAALTATNQIRSHRASADVSGGNPNVAQNSDPTTVEPVALAATQPTVITSDISSRSPDSVIPVQPVALVPESTSATTASVEPTSPQVREVSTEGSGAYQQLAQEISAGNLSRAREYLTPIATQANVDVDELLLIMQTKVTGQGDGSEILRQISVDELAGSLAAIIDPGGTSAESQVAALRDFRFGGAAGAQRSVIAHGRATQIAQALLAPDLPQPSSIVVAVPAIQRTIVPAVPNAGSRETQRSRDEEDEEPRDGSTGVVPADPTSAQDDLPEYLRGRVTAA